MMKWKTLGLLGVAALQLPGCVFVDDNDPPEPVGALTVEWTIDGFTDPRDCRDFGADRFELVIYDDTDFIVDRIEPICESFGVSIDLLEGYYAAEATLVDGADRSVTTTEPLNAIRIVRDTELVIPVDFPPGSFL